MSLTAETSGVNCCRGPKHTEVCGVGGRRRRRVFDCWMQLLTVSATDVYIVWQTLHRSQTCSFAGSYLVLQTSTYLATDCSALVNANLPKSNYKFRLSIAPQKECPCVSNINIIMYKNVAGIAQSL
jgi:hypothetical protein